MAAFHSITGDVNLFKTAWERYKLFGKILGDFQGRAFAMLFYFTVMIPFGLGTRLFSDPLHLKVKEPIWLEREPVGSTLQDARRQG